MKTEVFKLSSKFVVLIFCVVLCMFWAIALNRGIGLYEPNTLIANCEAILLMSLAGLGIIVMYWEVKK